MNSIFGPGSVNDVARKDDTYQTWKRLGTLKSKLDFVKKATASFYTQRQIANELNISEATFISIKKKHVDVVNAIKDGEDLLMKNVYNAIYQRAIGFEHVSTIKTAEKGSLGQTKQKIVEDPKYFPPDLDSAKYILVTKFGRAFNPKKDELDIMEKRLEKEEWDSPLEEEKKEDD